MSTLTCADQAGIGDSLLMKGIAEATGRSLAQIKSDMVEHGDLGLLNRRLGRKS